MAARPRDVRFTPKSGHRNSVVECPLLTQSGHGATAFCLVINEQISEVASFEGG